MFYKDLKIKHILFLEKQGVRDIKNYRFIKGTQDDWVFWHKKHKKEVIFRR